MRAVRHLIATAVIFAGLGPLYANAADVAAADQVEIPEAVEVRDIIMDLGLGAQIQPQFPSSEKYEVVPMPLFRMLFLRLPGVGEVVDGKEKPRGFSLYPAFNIIGSRDDADASYLEGLGDIDTAVELGAGAAVRYGFVRAFAEVRYGVTGHSGFVAEGGVDAVYGTAYDRFSFRLGPRISFASDDFMETYFGVTPAAVELPTYDPSAGIRDIGAALEARYAVTEKIGLVGRAEYRHFVGEALDSPIVEAGNDHEFRVGIGLTYRFGLDLY